MVCAALKRQLSGRSKQVRGKLRFFASFRLGLYIRVSLYELIRK